MVDQILDLLPSLGEHPVIALAAVLIVAGSWLTMGYLRIERSGREQSRLSTPTKVSGKKQASQPHLQPKHRLYLGGAVIATFIFSSVLWVYMSTSGTSMFARAFAEEDSRAVAVDWLKRRQGMFHIDDPSLADTLARLVPVRFGGLTGSSVMEESRRANEQLQNHPALNELRQRALAQQPPFQPIGIPVRVGLPEYRKDQPSPCRMHVVDNSSLENRRIKITNPQNGRWLVLFGVGTITPPFGAEIHLNSDQADWLFGPILGGPTAEAVALVQTGDGTLRDIPTQPECKSSDLLAR